MRRAMLTLTILAIAAGTALAGVTKEDLKKLIGAGVSDDVVLAFVRANGPVDNLSADDIIELKKAGASDKLLQSVLGDGASEKPRAQQDVQPAPQPAPQAEPPRTIERETVYLERPTTTYYYSDYPSAYYYGSPAIGTTYCGLHRVYDGCGGRTTYYYPTYSYPSTTYYYTYPSHRYSSYGSGCSPSYGLYYHRHSRRGSFSFRVGW